MRTSNRYAIILITCLFFLWGFALNLNPILIPHLKKACQLTDTQSALIDSASYFAYFIIAIPAGLFMKRAGYKYGIIAGLLLFAVGAFLFYPAAESRQFIFFLVALFIIASGLTFLETAANPYIILLGDEKSAAQRINFAQSFNGLAATLAPLMGSIFILSGSTISDADKRTMTGEQLNRYLANEASTVQTPYLFIGAVVLLVAVLLWFTMLPAIDERERHSDLSIWKEKNLLFATVAQFFYVGAQVCISSFFIRFSQQVAGIEEKAAALLLSGALLGFMIGRFVGTSLMRYISPAKLLAIYSFINFWLLLFAVMTTGKLSVYALVGSEFFMSIMFPTIFSLGIQGLGSKTKTGSSLLIMSIVGGAVFPLLMGRISDMSNMQTAYIVPAMCFLMVFGYSLRHLHVKKLELSTVH